jgi:hypothetical protein
MTLDSKLCRKKRSTICETKEAARIGYNGFLFPHEYSGEGRIYNSFAWCFIVQI